uniref:Uncharacterized protein n=1 Tax=Oryza sativa subsp. japonica TaxID=39947 RepID=Q69X08_ORYSJ|nr:hypothetical protein [Oryza sativa Japonica Group]
MTDRSIDRAISLDETRSSAFTYYASRCIAVDDAGDVRDSEVSGKRWTHDADAWQCMITTSQSRPSIIVRLARGRVLVVFLLEP